MKTPHGYAELDRLKGDLRHILEHHKLCIDSNVERENALRAENIYLKQRLADAQERHELREYTDRVHP